MDIYSRLTDIVIVHIVYIYESNPYTPLVSIKSIQNRYQLSQTRLYLTRRPPIPPTTHPFLKTTLQPFCLPDQLTIDVETGIVTKQIC